jgi:hypothetical protein
LKRTEEEFLRSPGAAASGQAPISFIVVGSPALSLGARTAVQVCACNNHIESPTASNVPHLQLPQLLEGAVGQLAERVVAQQQVLQASQAPHAVGKACGLRGSGDDWAPQQRVFV